MNPRELNDEVVITILDKTVEIEFTNEAEQIDFIREVMDRKLWVNCGANSMFDFMVRARYKYANGVAQRKLNTAHLMQRFPELKDYMLSEDINISQIDMFMSALRQIARPHCEIPVEKQKAALEAIRGQNIPNTQIILNEIFEIEPKKHNRARVQRDGSVRAEWTFSKDKWERLQRASEVLSHIIYDGDLTEVIDYCVRFTLSKKDPMATSSRNAARKSQAKTQKTKKTSVTEVEFTTSATEVSDAHLITSVTEVHYLGEYASAPNVGPQCDYTSVTEVTYMGEITSVAEVPGPENVSRAARRFVFQRDYSCRHKHENGTLCESRYQLQVDHVISKWQGGGNNVENLQLLCGHHNRLKYEREILERRVSMDDQVHFH